MIKRTDRLNSLLKEVLSEVIHRDIHHVAHINEFVTITRVEITNDLYHAKVFISVIGPDKEKKLALEALQRISRTIGYIAKRKVVMRYFPELHFELDFGLEKQLRIEELLFKVSEERETRDGSDVTEPFSAP